MNRWQIMFLVVGIVASAMLFVFPPQFISRSTVKFSLITDGYPIDWFQLFMWFIAIVFMTGLGIAINKEEHK